MHTCIFDKEKKKININFRLDRSYLIRYMVLNRCKMAMTGLLCFIVTSPCPFSVGLHM